MGASLAGRSPALPYSDLLDDVKSGRVDVVVAYKIDRLTRSLADFAKIVEIFDERSVSFVSVAHKPAEPSTPDPGLLSRLKQAHQLLQALTDGTGLTIADLAAREQMDVSDLSRIIRFAFMAPDLAEAIIEGRQPVELTRHQLSRLPELPHLWADQRAVLSF